MGRTSPMGLHFSFRYEGPGPVEAGKFRSVKKEFLDGACPELDEKTGESTGRPFY